jgi:hypothetical protein
MNRVFGVRAVSLGLGYLASSGEARRLWHRLWLEPDLLPLIWSAVCQPPASSGTADAILVEDALTLPGRHEQKIQLGRLPSSG